MITVPPPTGQQRSPSRQQVQAAAMHAGVILPDEAMLAFQQGRLIEAIKLIRSANPGLDLARAKALLQRLQAQAVVGAGTHAEAARPPVTGEAGREPPVMLGARRPPTVAMGDPPGSLRWLLAVLALLGAAGWIAFRGG